MLGIRLANSALVSRHSYQIARHTDVNFAVQRTYVFGRGDDESTDKDKSRSPLLIPYSQSLPTPGHDWCTRCEIRSHKFQKRITCQSGRCGSPRLDDRNDACANLPPGHVCQPAERYFRQQRDLMLGIAAVVFVVPNVVSAIVPVIS